MYTQELLLLDWGDSMGCQDPNPVLLHERYKDYLPSLLDISTGPYTQGLGYLYNASDGGRVSIRAQIGSREHLCPSKTSHQQLCWVPCLIIMLYLGSPSTQHQPLAQLLLGCSVLFPKGSCHPNAVEERHRRQSTCEFFLWVDKATCFFPPGS